MTDFVISDTFLCVKLKKSGENFGFCNNKLLVYIRLNDIIGLNLGGKNLL